MYVISFRMQTIEKGNLMITKLMDYLNHHHSYYSLSLQLNGLLLPEKKNDIHIVSRFLINDEVQSHTILIKTLIIKSLEMVFKGNKNIFLKSK